MNTTPVSRLLGLLTPEREIHLINSENYTRLDGSLLNSILDEIGKDSQVDQRLPKPVTSLEYVRKGHDILLLTSEWKIEAFCKLGVKHLFQYLNAEPMELCALCILDIYVYDQRAGTGSLLIELIERLYNVQFGMLAIDNPSLKMESFLEKKWGSYSGEQNTKFVMRDFAIQQLSEAFRRRRFEASRGGLEFNYNQLEIPEYLHFFGGEYPDRDVFQVSELRPQEAQKTEKPLETSPVVAPNDDDVESGIIKDYLQCKRRKLSDAEESIGEIGDLQEKRYIRTGFW